VLCDGAPSLPPDSISIRGPLNMGPRTFHTYRHVTTMNYLISGASGLIGTVLCERLRQQGHNVHRMVRRPAKTMNEVTWDPTMQRLDPRAFEGIDGVVHLAGENVAGGRWTASRKAKIEASRRSGTELIASAMAIADTGPAVLVSASAIGLYGSRDEALLDEASAPGRSFLADVCQTWEASAQPARDAGIRVVHPRIGLVLAANGGALQRMLLPFRLGVGGPIGKGDNWLSWISLHDQVRVLEFALDHERLEGPVNSVAPNPVRFTEFARVLGRVLRRPSFLHTPAFAMRLAMGELVDELMLASTRVEPKALKSMGFTFEHPDLESALRSVLNRPSPRLSE
jgi:uncharacterized protein